MSLTARDRKILLAVVALAAIVGYWFLALSPKREEAAKAADELAQQEERRDAALARLAEFEAAKAEYASDYATVVRLGKAIPASVDTSSLIVQLQRASRGTNIDFNRIATGERTEAAGGASASPPAPPGGNGSTPAAPGGAPAQTAPGAKTEGAGNAVNGANQTSAQSESAANGSGVAPGDAQTSESTREGGLPVGGGSTPGGQGDPKSPTAPGLESVPLDFEFSGSFFDLADFFHDLKRFVKVANDRIDVQGRLMTIDGLSLGSDSSTFPDLRAEVKATVYLTPKAEGPTAGATPAGPAGAAPAGDSSVAEDSSGNPPTAAVTP